MVIEPEVLLLEHRSSSLIAQAENLVCQIESLGADTQILSVICV